METLATTRQICYYYFDALGSVTDLSNTSGKQIEHYYYDPFGKTKIYDAQGVKLTSFAYGNYYCFTARQWDSETNLYYYRARMYDPKLGRFLQADPVGYNADINLYRYVNNNAINFVDPLGLFHFGKRPLEGLPMVPGLSSNPIDDSFNTELSHEHGFFDDGSGDNVGFGPDGPKPEDPTGKGYEYDDKHYDDDIMREALDNVYGIFQRV